MLLAPLAPRPASPLEFRLLAYPSQALYFLLLALLVVHASTAWQSPARRLLLGLGIAAALVVALNLLAVPVASDLAKVAFATIAGTIFVRVIERPWWLVPICVCVPLADSWSVFSSRGVTHAVVQHARHDPAWIRWPTIATPIAGYPYEQFARIGIVDVLFLALLLGCAVRWRLGTWRGVLLMAAGFVGTSALVFEAVDVAVPALPLLCTAFLVAYAPALWRDLRDAARR